jgi:hypothetical protein
LLPFITEKTQAGDGFAMHLQVICKLNILIII